MSNFGEMLEWLKRHAWKACVPQKGIASSNLALSAKNPYRVFCKGFFVRYVIKDYFETGLSLSIPKQRLT